MNSPSPYERLLRTLELQEVDRPPVVCVNQTGTLEGMESAGVYWPDAHGDAEKMAKLAITGHTVLGFEAVRVPFDQAVEAEALGCKARMERKDEIPSIVSTPFKEPSDLKLPDRLEESGRVPVVSGAVRKLREEVGNTVPILVGVTGPFTMGGMIMGLWTFIKWTRDDISKVEQTLQFTGEVAKAYASILVKAGADVVVVEDMLASPDMMNPAFFKEHIAQHLAETMKSIDAYTVLHICGNASKIVDDMVSSGASGISIDFKTDPRLAKEKTSGKCALIGNLDPVRVLHEGKPEQVKEAALAALTGGVDVLAPGCSITPYTSSSNTRALIESVETFQRTRKG